MVDAAHHHHRPLLLRDSGLKKYAQHLACEEEPSADPARLAAIVGDGLFWSSGNYTFDDDGSSTWSTTSSLYWLRLNDTIDVHGPIDMSLVGSAALPSDALTGSASPMSGGAAGTFFYDHTMLYAYAGMVGPEANGVDNQLWAFNTTTDAWEAGAGGGRAHRLRQQQRGRARDRRARTGTSFLHRRLGRWPSNGSNNGTVKFESGQWRGTGDQPQVELHDGRSRAWSKGRASSSWAPWCT